MRGVEAHTWAEPTAASVPHTVRQTWGSFLARQPSWSLLGRDGRVWGPDLPSLALLLVPSLGFIPL